jgi:alpha-galactosidase
MMPNLKITLVGAGSYVWTPGVLSNLLSNPGLNGSHIVMHDINPEPLELGYKLALRYQEASGTACTFEQTTEQAAALEGADFVTVTISTGGLKAMQHDLEIPERYGIFQTVGDTVGPGGLCRSLRNIPVFVGIARTMEKQCPEAWMINVSNPLATITRAVNKETSIRALGMCHGVHGTAQQYVDYFGASAGEVAFVNTGIDHCSWFTEFVVQGRDAGELLEEKGLDAWLAKPPAEAEKDPAFGPLFNLRCSLLLGRELAALPAIGDRHMVEFFPNYLRSPETVAKYGLIRTTIADRVKNYQTARARIDRIVNGEEQPRFEEAVDVVGVRQSDDVASWILALTGRGPAFEDNVNAPNTGQVPELPPGCIVETRAVLDAAGVHPLSAPLTPALEPAVVPHVLRQELTVEAGIEGDFEKAIAVLAGDPLITGAETVRPMLRQMLEATKEWVPQFGL